MLRLAFDFIIAWREIRARPNAYWERWYLYSPRMQAVQPTPANRTVYRCGLHGLQVWAINLSPLKLDY